MGVSLVVLVIIILALAWMRHDVTVRVQDIEQSRSMLSLRIRSLEVFSVLKNQSAEARQYSSIIERKMPRKDELVNFPKTLERIAEAHNITSEFSFNAEIAPMDGSPGAITFTLVLSGEYSSITAFLYEFNGISYVVVFDTFDMVRTSEAFRGTFQGRVFYR